MDKFIKGVKIPKQREDGRYYKAVKACDPVTGQEGKISVYGQTAKEFADKVLLAQAQYQINKEAYAAQDNQYKIGPWLEHQLTRKLNQKKRISSNTYRSYEGAVKNHIIPFFGEDRVITSIRKSDIEALYRAMADKGLTSVIKDVKAMLRYAFEDAADNDIIPKNPVLKAQIPSLDKKRRRALRHDEETRFIRAVEPERQAIAYYLALWAGLRIGEVVGLKWENIDFENKIIRIVQQLSRKRKKITEKETTLTLDDTKSSNSVRDLPIPHKLFFKLLKHYQDQTVELGREPMPDDFVVINQVGNPQEPTKISRRMGVICDAAKIEPKICYHELRHTCGTRLAEKGATKQQIAAILGQEMVTNLDNRAEKRTATDDYLHIDTLTLRDLMS